MPNALQVWWVREGLTRMYAKARNLSKREQQIAGGIIRGLYHQGE
jgi:hypothetical protein